MCQIILTLLFFCLMWSKSQLSVRWNKFSLAAESYSVLRYITELAAALTCCAHIMRFSIYIAHAMNKSRPRLPPGSTTVTNDCNNESSHTVIITVSITFNDFIFLSELSLSHHHHVPLSSSLFELQMSSFCLFCRVAGERTAVHRLCEFVVIKAG